MDHAAPVGQWAYSSVTFISYFTAHYDDVHIFFFQYGLYTIKIMVSKLQTLDEPNLLIHYTTIAVLSFF